MKATYFKQSVLTAGVIAALGLSSNAIAAEQVAAEATSQIQNIANATYKVDGVAQTAVQSNPVVVNITEKGAFSLVANNTTDGTAGDDFNDKEVAAPNGFVQFDHRLTNSGNVADSYTMGLTQNGSTPATGTDTKDYDLASSTVSYTVYAADGSTIRTVTDQSVEDFNTSQIDLKPGEYADITVNAKTNGNVGGDTQNLTLSAKSEYFTNDATPGNDTLENVDNSITKLPVFKIIKSVSDTLNLNDPNDTASYQIVVTNDGSAAYAADAINATVKDSLPVGLKLAGTPIATGGTGTNVVTVNTNGAGAGTAQDGFEVTGIDLAVGESITITFDVQKDADETLAANTVNHASVEDDLDEDPNTDNTVVDSTDANDPNQNTDQFYPSTDDSEVTDGSTPTTPGGDSTEPLVSNERGLNLSGPTTEEIPNTSTENTEATHSVVITNTGKEIEGDKAGEVTFTITDAGKNANVQPEGGSVQLVYDVDGDPSTTNDQTLVTLTPDPTTGIYDINDTLPNGMAPGSTVTIIYDVESTDAETGTTEETVVTLIPGGTDAPTTGNFKVTDTTEVKGLALLKEQALDAACDGTADTAFSINPIAATPNQCVIYKITATNGFDGLAMTDVLIYDTTARFTGKAAYQNDGTISVSSTNSQAPNGVKNDAASSAGVDAIYSTVTTLAATDKATLQFSIKINPEGTTPGTP